MDKSIEQLGQDLARSKYAKSTRSKYVIAACPRCGGRLFTTAAPRCRDPPALAA